VLTVAPDTGRHVVIEGPPGTGKKEFESVLAAVQDGSESAFSRLWRDGNPVLLRYLRILAPEAAEDIAADTWLQVVRGLAAFRGDAQGWRAWLFATARRRAIDEARRRSRRPEKALEGTLPGRLPVSPDAADLALENIGTRSALALVAGDPVLRDGRATRQVLISDAATVSGATRHWPADRAPCTAWLRPAERAPHATQE
jgi:sigma-70-like protein